MTSFAVALGIAALTLLAYGGFRSWFAPAVLYCGYWACIAAAIGLLQIGDHHIGPQALLVFTVGAACYAGASGIVALLHRRRGSSEESNARHTSPQRKRTVQSAIIAYSVLLGAMVPAFVASVRAAGAALGIEDFATAARVGLSLADRAGVPQYFLSAISLGSFLAYFAAWVYQGERRDKITLGAITLATLVMSGLTFGRSPVVALMVGVLSILSLRGVVSTKTTASIFGGTIVLALVIGAMLSKGPDFASGQSAGGAIVDNLAVYFVGGPVGFSEVMSDPAAVGEPGLSVRLLRQFAIWAGFQPHVPDNILDYTTTDLGNVYTFYYPYWYDAGWVGVMLASLAAGAVSTAIYLAARDGNPMAGASFGLVVSSTITSAVGDGMFASPVQWILAFGVGWLLWHIPTRWRRQRVSQMEPAA